MRLPFSLTPYLTDFQTKRTSHLRLTMVLGILIAVLIIGIATAETFHSRRPSPIVKEPAASARSQDHGTEAHGKQTVEALPLQLKRGGFVPMEITRPAGDFLFSVSNQSGVAEIDLRLGRENGARLHEARLKRERLRWRQQVRLTPGTYLLTEANHPNWVCRIVITAH